MDEIDAALDYKNVAIVGKYIKEGVCKRSSAAQAAIDSKGSRPTDSPNKAMKDAASLARNS